MEALILYFVLFFPGVYTPFHEGFSSSGTIPFSAMRELGRTFTYSLPSLALLWYLISDKKGFSAIKETFSQESGLSQLIGQEPNPVILQKRDLFSFAAGFPGLVIIGLFISLLISLFSQQSALTIPPMVEGPANFIGWVVMVFSCIATGYLEESYFRYYLLTKLESYLPQPVLRIALSTVLFSLCHFYEGPWGVLNAVLAGVLLSILFIRFESLHGIAFAHGAYNIFVYIAGSVSK